MKKGLLSIILAFLTTGVEAQILKNLGGQRAGISALPFLKMQVSPKADGMAGSQVSAKADPYAVNWNPAGLTEIQQTTFAGSDKLLPSGIHNTFFTTVIPTEDDGVWSGSITMLSTGEMKKRTAYQPDGNGQTFYAYNMAIGLGFARKLSDRFSLGGRAQYVREQLAEFNANTAVLDLAFLYRMDVQGIRFAVALKNFGPNSTIKGTFDKTPPPYNGNQNSVTDFPTPTQFQIGFSMEVFESGNQALRGHLQLNHPNDNSENLRIGFNYQLHEVLFLQTGYKLPNTGQAFPTFGLGLKSRIGRHPFLIDYSIINRDHLGLTHNFGVRFTLNRKTR